LTYERRLSWNRSPILPVLRGAKVDVSDVRAAGKVVHEDSHELVTQILVEEQLRATELARRHSRASEPRATTATTTTKITKVAKGTNY
jgi:hypothetical protein